MRRSIKITLGVALGLLVLIAVAGGYFWYQMGEPLYRPGLVRSGQNLRAPLVPPAQTSDAHFWQVESDIRLYHFSEGQGKDVLIIHGGPGYPYTKPWPGLSTLTGQYRFNYYDQRGCGQSTRPFDRFTSSNNYENMQTLDKTLGIGAQLADIERIRQILGQDKLILVGHSFGGFLAALYAAEFPEHVQALVLVSPAEMLVMPPEDGGLFEEVRKRLPASQQAEYSAFVNEYLAFGNLFSKSEADLIALNERFGQYYQEAIKTPLPEEGKGGGWMVWAMYLGLGTRHDYRDALKKVTAPVLVLHGANDLQPEKESQMYTQLFPRAQFKVIQDTGHFSFNDKPEEFGAAVRDFLEGAD